MSHDPLDAVPMCLYVGDSLAVRIAAQGDVAPPDYALAFTVVGPSKATVAGVADGTVGWIVTLPSATTAALLAGVYGWAAQASEGGERHTLCSGRLDLLADPAELAAGTEQRATARQLLEALDAMLATKGSVTSFSIFGRSYTFETFEGVQQWRAYLTRLARDDDEEERKARGWPSRRVAWVRF